MFFVVAGKFVACGAAHWTAWRVGGSPPEWHTAMEGKLSVLSEDDLTGVCSRLSIILQDIHTGICLIRKLCLERASKCLASCVAGGKLWIFCENGLELLLITCVFHRAKVESFANPVGQA